MKTEHRQWPVERTTVAIDPATGQVTDKVEWTHYPLPAKATTLGILFHQAELFGLANQTALTALALGLIVLIIAAYVMWWQRPPGRGVRRPAPDGPATAHRADPAARRFRPAHGRPAHVGRVVPRLPAYRADRARRTPSTREAEFRDRPNRRSNPLVTRRMHRPSAR